MLRAVLYLRSSKDRHDVSIDAQRRELIELARARGYAVAGEFADVVESGKDDDRPGLQALLAALHARDRDWTAVLALDTSRIARRAAAAYWFEDRECRPRGVSVVYKNLPDMDEAERAIVKAVFHGVDEWHSLVSKRKGLAGMRENVRNGYRAGGRAPTGYRLEHTPTGAVREGQAVTKSKLVVCDDHKSVQGFLRDRAAGVLRMDAARRNGLTLSQTSLIGIERNALTYAGHTVWNMRPEKGAIDAQRYRPRAEWVVKRDTHPALITDVEAEAILKLHQVRHRHTCQLKKHDYLLAGLLHTPAGVPWHGSDAAFYRHGKARRVLARKLDRAVVDAVAEELAGGQLAQRLLEHMRARLVVAPDAKRAAALRRQVDTLDRQIRRLADLAADAETAAPLLRTMGEKEREREAAQDELQALEREAGAQKALRTITIDQVRQALRSLAVDVASRKDVPGLRDQLLQLVSRVELDPDRAEDVAIHYRIPAIGGFTGVELASPQRPELHPGNLLVRRVKLAA